MLVPAVSGSEWPTPLMLAAYSGQLDMVRFLLDHEADIHVYRATYVWRVREVPFIGTRDFDTADRC